MECLQCGNDVLHGRHFCSSPCRHEWEKTMPFVLACYCCSADEGGLKTVDEAHAAGWEGIVPDPGGLTWNYIGDCPDCAAWRKTPNVVVEPIIPTHDLGNPVG